MSSSEPHSYQLDVYVGPTCWRGIFAEANARRISDILNDRSHPFITLHDAIQITWDDSSPQESARLGTITVVKRNAIAIVVGNAAQVSNLGSGVLRVNKTPRRVALSAPPIEAIGNIHLSKGAELLNLLGSDHLDFFALTSMSLRWLDGRAPLPNSAGLIFINRGMIACIQEIPVEANIAHTEILDASMDVTPLPVHANALHSR